MVAGRGLPPGLAIELAVDDRTVEQVRANQEGAVAAMVSAPREWGLHSITVRDAESRRVLDGAMFIVKHQDLGRGRSKGRSDYQRE